MAYLGITLYIINVLLCLSFLFYLAYKITRKNDDYLNELLKEEKQ